MDMAEGQTLSIVPFGVQSTACKMASDCTAREIYPTVNFVCNLAMKTYSVSAVIVHSSFTACFIFVFQEIYF